MDSLDDLRRQIGRCLGFGVRLGFGLRLRFRFGLRLRLGFGFRLRFGFGLRLRLGFGFRFWLGLGFRLRLSFGFRFRISFGFIFPNLPLRLLPVLNCSTILAGSLLVEFIGSLGDLRRQIGRYVGL